MNMAKINAAFYTKSLFQTKIPIVKHFFSPIVFLDIYYIIIFILKLAKLEYMNIWQQRFYW